MIRSARKTLGLQIKDGALIVRAPLHMPQSEIDRFLQKARPWIEKSTARLAHKEAQLSKIVPLTEQELNVLYQRARAVIPQRVAYYAALLGVTYGRITIRCQKTRWGSCNSKGNLNFNCLLMLTPPEVLDSVVVHELCHRKEMNHSARFYAEVMRVLPDYPRLYAWLKKEGDALMARVPRDRL